VAVSLSTITTAVSGITSILLVSPQTIVGYQPQPSLISGSSVAANPPAFLFHYEGENTATIDSDITDEFVEDNTAIQDQIALRPILVTTQGFIGELNNIPPLPSGLAGQIISTALNALTPLAQYAPGVSVTAQNAYNEAFFAIQVANAAKNNAVAAWSTITGTGGESVIGPNGIAIQPNQSKQQTAFQTFFGYWTTRTLFTIQTPWVIMQNMAIKTLKAIQSPETNVITDFEITFKQMRFASSLLGNPTSTLPYSLPENFGGRLQQQGALPVDLGTSNLTTSPTGFTSALSGVA